MTTVIDLNTAPQQAALVAHRVRQIGVKRVLCESATPHGERPAQREAWGAFKRLTPLSEAKFEPIAGNTAY